jgi:hypothetical protein
VALHFQRFLEAARRVVPLICLLSATPRAHASDVVIVAPTATRREADFGAGAAGELPMSAALEEESMAASPGEALASDLTAEEVTPLEGALPLESEATAELPPPFGYDTADSATTWLPGDEDQFGWVSLESLAVLSSDSPGGVVGGIGVHFLDGPARSEMPPRLFDFVIGYHRREWIRPHFGWDFVFRVGAFSDFEGSAEDGVRFPSHAVAFFQIDRQTTWLLGVDYLDRDDVSALPVAGLVWAPTDDFRLDAAFPRPRAALRVIDSDCWLYLGGELGGGTWAIERDDSWNDNATYSDLRLVFGIETSDGANGRSALELGYVFDRELSYRSGLGDYKPQECLMIRLVSRQ